MIDENLPNGDAKRQDILARFDVAYPTEEDCMEELVRNLSNSDIEHCPYCHNTQVDRNYGSRIIYCRVCRNTTSLTAGTFFHGIRSARPWLAAIWFMEQGLSINSHRFHILLNIAYASAIDIFRKLTTVMEQELAGNGDVVSARSFFPLIARRSNLSQGKDVRQELESLESLEVRQEEQNSSASEGLQLPDDEKLVYEAISTEPIQFESLFDRLEMDVGKLSGTLVMLELDGLVLRLPGNHYVRVKGSIHERSPQAEEGRETIWSAIAFLRAKFQFVSLKYLQNYLVWYWYHSDRDRWCFASVLQSCCRFGRLTGKQVFERVSSNWLKMPLLQPV